MDHEWRIPRSADSDPELLRSNISEHFLVGYACAPSVDNAVSLTLGLVTDGAHPEARPVRVLVSRKTCGELALALARLALAFPAREGTNREPAASQPAPELPRADLCLSAIG